MKPTDCDIYRCKTPADHYRHGGRWYATNAKGDIAHILPGKSAIARCEKTPPGVPVDQIPEGARVCKTCAKAQTIVESNELRSNRSNALSGLNPYRTRMERRAGGRAADVRALWEAADELIRSAPSCADVWDAFDMYRQDAVRHLERAA